MYSTQQPYGHLSYTVAHKSCHNRTFTSSSRKIWWHREKRNAGPKSAQFQRAILWDPCHSLIFNYTLTAIIGHLNSNDNEVKLVNTLTFACTWANNTHDTGDEKQITRRWARTWHLQNFRFLWTKRGTLVLRVKPSEKYKLYNEHVTAKCVVMLCRNVKTCLLNLNLVHKIV